MSTTNGSTDNTTPATTTLVDPYEQFAAREGGPEFFEGDLIKFVKGKWERGQDKQAIGATEMFTANLAELHEGWIRFEDGRVADREIGRVASGYVHPPRSRLANWINGNGGRTVGESREIPGNGRSIFPCSTMPVNLAASPGTAAAPSMRWRS